MKFINRISQSLWLKTVAGAHRLWLPAMCMLLAATGLAYFNSRRTLAKQAFHPLTIDQVLMQRQKLSAVGGVANEHFGTAVAFSDDTLVISAPDNNGREADKGSVYVFTRSGGTWTLQQILVAQDGATNSGFGFSVALSGDTVVIGAPLDDVGGNEDQGSAYVFTRTGTAWTQQRKLTAQDGAANDFFGLSVAVSGETVVVTAFGDDIGGSKDQGSAYIFTRNGANWSEQQKLIASDGAAGQFFGRSVALSGDTVVVGENIDSIGTHFDQGSAYVFFRNGTVWTQQQKLTAADRADGDQFGLSVSISGDTIVVGAPDDDIGGKFDQGSAYVFTRSGASWTQQQKLTADDGAAVDFFGSSLALVGDTIAVGAENDQIGGNADNLGQGSAYVFTRIGTVWTQRQKLIADDGAAVDRFGSAVALGGDTVVVGAPLGDVDANRDQGSAYVFVLPGCFFSVAPINFAFSAQGGTGEVRVNAVDGCAWTAVSNDPMITVIAGASSTGSGTVRFAVANQPNTGFRRGVLTVADHQVTIVQAAPVACVSAASFIGSSLAAESIVAAFGSRLANGTEVATTQPLPTTLAGTKVSVLDSLGMKRDALLFFVSPTQINLQIPAGTAAGQALVTILQGEETVAAQSLLIDMISPGLFSANASGQGLLAGVALRLKADGSQSFEPVARFDDQRQQFVAAPINLNPETDHVFLLMFGTGLRHGSSLDAISVKIGGVNVDVFYGGPQGSFVGLDQLNVLVPPSLAGRGEVDVNVTVDGVAANNLKLAIK